MEEVEIVKVSGRSLIAIPPSLKRKLDIKRGDAFIIAGEGDVLVMKRIGEASLGEIAGILKSAHKSVKKKVKVEKKKKKRFFWQR